MKKALLIYCSSILCVAFSLPNKANDKKQIESQSKRDTSYSYVASDIKSNEGSHIKTISVLKHINNGNNKAINLNPIDKKDKHWTDNIHENFEVFGKIPEVPDIDDLFEFTKNIKPIKPMHKIEKDINTGILMNGKPTESSESEIPTESESEKPTESESEKPATIANEKNDAEISKKEMKEIKKSIPDDVELISTVTNLKQKSQSLQYVPQPESSKKINVQIQLPQSQQLQNKYITEYSTPEHSVRQYFISSADTEKSAEYKKIPTYTKPNYNNNFPAVYSPQPPLPSKNIPTPKNSNGIIGNRQAGGVTTTQTNQSPYLAPNKFKNDRKKPTKMPFIASSQTPYLAPSIKKVYEVQLLNNKNNNLLINNGTNNINQTKSIVPPLNLRIGSNIPLGAVTRSRGIRY